MSVLPQSRDAEQSRQSEDKGGHAQRVAFLVQFPPQVSTRLRAVFLRVACFGASTAQRPGGHTGGLPWGVATARRQRAGGLAECAHGLFNGQRLPLGQALHP